MGELAPSRSDPFGTGAPLGELGTGDWELAPQESPWENLLHHGVIPLGQESLRENWLRHGSDPFGIGVPLGELGTWNWELGTGSRGAPLGELAPSRK